MFSLSQEVTRPQPLPKPEKVEDDREPITEQNDVSTSSSKPAPQTLSSSAASSSPPASTSKEQNKKVLWTPLEDSRLRSIVLGNSEGVDENGKTIVTLTWGEISEMIPGRSAKQCRERWTYNLDPSINSGPWRIEEDAILLKAHSEQYPNQWASIAKLLPGRTENAVKTRYKSMMRAKKREWSAEEDELMYDLVSKYGSKWDIIQKFFPNRTANALKTRFSQTRKKNKRKWNEERPSLSGGNSSATENEEEEGAANQVWQNEGLVRDIDLFLLLNRQKELSGKPKKARLDGKQQQQRRKADVSTPNSTFLPLQPQHPVTFAPQMMMFQPSHSQPPSMYYAPASAHPHPQSADLAVMVQQLVHSLNHTIVADRTLLLEDKTLLLEQSNTLFNLFKCLKTIRK